MDSVVHGVTKSQTQLSDFHFLSLIGKSLWSFCPFISPPSIRDLGLEVGGGGLSIRVEKQERRAWQGRGEAKQGHSRNAEKGHSFPSLEPVHCSMSSSDCFFMTCIHISQEAGKVKVKVISDSLPPHELYSLGFKFSRP